jgi:ABC-type bacteriocin/lantibiotic exporter with double-glycine peptidase domain
MLSLPHHKQKTLHDCGAACLQMIFEYFGKMKTQEELSKALCAGPDIWVTNEDLETIAQNEGLHTRSMTGATIEDLKGFIEKDIPVIINYIDPDNQEGHFAVVVDVTHMYIVLNDPWYGKDFPLPLSYILANWRSYEGDRPQWLLAVSKEKIAV